MPLVTLEIAGEEAELGSLFLVDLGIRHWRPFPRSPFKLAVDRLEFRDWFDGVYGDLIQELRRDDELVGRFQSPFPGATDYPSRDALFDLPRASKMELINTFLRRDIFERYLAGAATPPEGQARWGIIDDIDDIIEEGNHVSIAGRAISTRCFKSET